jgi:hypothetical protein
MTEIINGQREAPLSGWVLAQCHGVLLVGKRAGKKVTELGAITFGPDVVTGNDDARQVLSPVFELKASLVPQGNAMGTVHMCFPLWLFTITEVELPAGAIVVTCDSLSLSEQTGLRRAIGAAEELLTQMKAAASGVTLAREMPKERRG